MRSRLSAAFLLVLSSIFMAGGLPAQQALAISAQVSAAPADQQTHRHAAPQPGKPKAAADSGAHHGFGGVACPPAKPQDTEPARGGACRTQNSDVPAAERPRANPARAPPLHSA